MSDMRAMFFINGSKVEKELFGMLGANFFTKYKMLKRAVVERGRLHSIASFGCAVGFSCGLQLCAMCGGKNFFVRLAFLK